MATVRTTILSTYPICWIQSPRTKKGKEEEKKHTEFFLCKYAMLSFGSQASPT